MSEKRQVRISEIIRLLKEEGKTRKEINELYELNKEEIKALWSNEKLKKMKTAKFVVGIEVVDDTEVVLNEVPKGVNPDTYSIGISTVDKEIVTVNL